MEKEVLFTEDVEPPGQSAGGAVNRKARGFSSDSNPFPPSDSSPQLSVVEPSRWAQRFVTSERSKWFRKNFSPGQPFGLE